MNNRKRKVCFVSPFAYGLFNPKVDLKFGGAEVQMYLISKELAKDNDFDVNFLVLDIGQNKEEEYEGVKVFKTYKRGRGILNLIKAPIQLILTLNKISPDIVINRAHGVEAGICAIYAKLFRKKFIYSIAHDSDVNGVNFKGFRGKIFEFGFKGANVLIAQSKNQVDLLKENFGQFVSKVVIIKNSFEIKKHDADKKHILWVGSSASVKRPKVLLDLAEKNPQEKFVIIITKSKKNLNLWDEIKERAEKMNNVEFIAKVPFEKISSYFVKAKVFINTSEFEGFPNTFLQAMIAYVPLLSLKVNPDNFISDYRCGFVCDDNEDVLNSKLKILLSNKEMRDKMAQNGFNYIQENHNIKKNIDKWKEQIQ